jgi:7-cyano-7-deazaguanine synthase
MVVKLSEQRGVEHAMKTVVLLSGGLDSTALLFYLLGKGHELRALGVNYGQRHKRELTMAREIASMAKVPYEIADLQPITRLLSNSALTNMNIEVPEGHYADENMKITVVPNRNMLMLSVAIAWAISEEFDAVAYAAHAGDHAIYPDCREDFIEALARAAALASWHPIQILRPFVHKTKAEIVKIGNQNHAPLDLTWSCYQGGSSHCGRCGTCVERREAFGMAGIPDPTAYTMEAGQSI